MGSCHPDYREAGMQNGEQVANFLRFLALLTSVSVVYPWLDPTRRHHMRIFCLHWFSGVMYVVSQFAMCMMVINCWSSNLAGPFIYFLKFVELTAVNLGAISSLAIAVLIASVVQAFSRMRRVPRVIGTTRCMWGSVAAAVGLSLFSAPFWNDIVVTGSYFWVTNNSNPVVARWISLSFVTSQTAAGILMAVVLIFTVSGKRRTSLRVCLKTSKRINLYFVLTILGTLVYGYNGFVLFIDEFMSTGAGKKQLIMVGWCSRFVHVIADTLVLYHAFQGSSFQGRESFSISDDCPNCGVGGAVDACAVDSSPAVDDIESNNGGQFRRGRIRSNASSSGSFCITGVGTKFRVPSGGGGGGGDGGSGSGSGSASGSGSGSGSGSSAGNGSGRRQASIEGNRFRKAVAALAMRSRSFTRQSNSQDRSGPAVEDVDRARAAAETGAGATAEGETNAGGHHHSRRSGTFERRGDERGDGAPGVHSPSESSSPAPSPSVTTASFHSYSSTSTSSSSSSSCSCSSSPSFLSSCPSASRPSRAPAPAAAPAWPPCRSTSVAAFSLASAIPSAPFDGKAANGGGGGGGYGGAGHWNISTASPAASSRTALSGSAGMTTSSSTPVVFGARGKAPAATPAAAAAAAATSVVGVGAAEEAGAQESAGAAAKGVGEARAVAAGTKSALAPLAAAAEAAAAGAPISRSVTAPEEAAGAAARSRQYAVSVISARRRAVAASTTRRGVWHPTLAMTRSAAVAGGSRTAVGDGSGGGADLVDAGVSGRNSGRRSGLGRRTHGNGRTGPASAGTARNPSLGEGDRNAGHGSATAVSGLGRRSIRDLHRHVAQQHRLLRRPPRIRTTPATVLPPRPRPGAAATARGGRGSGGIGAAASIYGVGRNRDRARAGPTRRPAERNLAPLR